jgi:hypothetical protein
MIHILLNLMEDSILAMIKVDGTQKKFLKRQKKEIK